MARSTFLGNARSFVTNALGGVKGPTNVAAWAVAGVAAYFLWVKPGREERQRQEERAARAREQDRFRYVERTKPIPDPQETGLIRGKGKDLN